MSARILAAAESARSAPSVPFKKGSRIFKQRAPVRILQAISVRPPSIRPVWRSFNSDSAKRKSIFLGERIFRFASDDFPPAERGLGNECGRDSLFVFGGVGGFATYFKPL